MPQTNWLLTSPLGLCPRPRDLSHRLKASFGNASDAHQVIGVGLAFRPGSALELVPTRALSSDQGLPIYNPQENFGTRHQQKKTTHPTRQTGTHRRGAKFGNSNPCKRARGTAHANGAIQFAFTDGSVRSIPPSIDMQSSRRWHQLPGMRQFAVSGNSLSRTFIFRGVPMLWTPPSITSISSKQRSHHLQRL